jgi:CDP-glycerol glycerophosphotransferase (TagB/SpsB family)
MKTLFYIAKKYSIPIIIPLISYMKTRGDNFSLYVSKKVLNHLPEEWKSYKVFQNVDQARKYNSDFVIAPGNFVDFRIPGIKVQIFHGLGIEKASHFKIRHFFDVYLTSGPFVTMKFNALQRKYHYFLVEETGWPKIDYILNYPSNDLKKSLDLPEEKKIILYSPTFSNKMQSATHLLPVIPEIIRDDEIWLFKFHEFMNKEIIRSFQHYKSDQIRIVDTFDITPYLYVSDVMISDTSSVIYEFMVLDKPVITFKTQSRFDKGIDIQSPSDLRTSIDRSFAMPDEYHVNRIKHLKEINPYLDGDICKRIVETLIDIKLNNRMPKKKKPFNLIRKLQILYHEKYRKGYLK